MTFHGSLSNICSDNSVWTKVMDQRQAHARIHGIHQTVSKISVQRGTASDQVSIDATLAGLKKSVFH